MKLVERLINPVARVKNVQSSRYFAVVSTAVGETAKKIYPVKLSTITFDDPQATYANSPSSELLKKGLLSSSMKFSIIYQNLPFLLGLSNKMMGTSLTNFLVKHTLFQHFCGGASMKDLLETGSKLASIGIGTMVDFPAEAEGESISSNWLDKNVDSFRKSISAAGVISSRSSSNQRSFLAMKFTALCEPEVLESLTYSLNIMHSLYAYGVNDLQEKNLSIYFPTGHDKYISVDLPVDKAQSILQSIWPSLDTDQVSRMTTEMQNSPGANPNSSDSDSHISYIQWTEYFSPERLANLPSPQIYNNREVTEILKNKYWPNSKILELYNKAMDRILQCTEHAKAENVGLLVDAESTNLQPAIDWMTEECVKKYCTLNSSDPTEIPGVVYYTFQMYCKNALSRLKTEAYRADLLGYKFCTKIVCGAYMSYESKLCNATKAEYPILDSFQASRDSYDAGVAFMMDRLPKSELCCASHNEDSIQKAARRLGIMTGDEASKYPMSFAQLYSMGDYLTYQLANAGVSVYKYTPYGAVDLVLPYLIRRAEENSSIFSHSGKESRLYWKELRRRMRAVAGLA